MGGTEREERYQKQKEGGEGVVCRYVQVCVSISRTESSVNFISTFFIYISHFL